MSMHRTLQSVVPGETTLVVAIDAGMRARTRLESLGLIPGASVEVFNNGRGPLIVSVGEGRIIVERGIADKVLVA
ncbi:ferrous iron transport protein A [Pseudodesulfovibrio sp. JC047]|uniref:FeoA family protein n=1 Tax=Pseudodesulfovibrio sp. JC047 TaxID=2683199 RepID=UPI0013D1659E|nr:FeoA family protein [Pseudodesulfovibrio sp. JC047]NDV19050.1 ferrous iron transport protein A [Pseudodesulfovibrio sp. JC047]